MSKNMRNLLFIFVLMMSLMLAACGGNASNNESSNSGAVELSESFTSESGVSVNYPEGWTAQDMDGQILVASSAEALDNAIGTASEDPEENDPSQAPEAGEIVVGVMAFPLAEMGIGDDSSIGDIFDMMISGMIDEGMEAIGDPEEMTIGDFEARQLKFTSEDIGGAGFILSFVDENSTMVTLFGMTAAGEQDNFGDIVSRIAESVEYTAPAS
jgi:hypothetical protein